MNKIFSVLRFLKIMDDGETSLSLSNITLIVAVVKIATAHVAPMDGAALFLAILNYSHKRYIGSQSDSNS